MSDTNDLLGYVRKRTLALREQATNPLAFGSSVFKAARNWAYTRGNTLGYQDTGSKLMDVDTGKMCARFKITSSSRDRMGDIVQPKGCLGTISHYKTNPRVFFGHESHDFPIGSARTPEGASTLEYAEDSLFATVYFNGLTEISNQVFAFVAAKELEATSIGFLPLKGAFIARAPKPEKSDEINFDFGGVVFEEWDLLEFSVVPVPANPDAVAMWLSKGVDGKPLAASLKSYLEPFAPPRKVWVPGVEMATFDTSPTPLASPLPETKDVPDNTPLPTPPASLPTEPVAVAVVVAPEVKDAPLPPPAAIKEPLPDSLPPTALAAPASPTSDDPNMPYGLRAMRCAMAHCDSVMCAVDSMCKSLEHPKVKKHLKKFSKRMAEHKDDMLETAKEHYPEHHGLPPNDTDDDKDFTPTVTRDNPPAPVLTPPSASVPVIDMTKVLAAIQDLNAAKSAMDDRLFAIDGKR